MTRSKYLLLSVLFVCAIVLAACGGKSGSGKTADGQNDQGTATAGAKDENVLIVGMDDDPPQLDPHFSTAAVDRQVFHSIYDKLVDVDDKLNFVPQLAADWKISEDGKVYTFHLQEGVQFHDGTPFNAEAVKYNFDRMMDASLGSSRTAELSLVENVEAQDEYTVVVTLSSPFSPFLATLADRAGMMLSPTALEEKGDDFQNSPVGTGPFKFVERVKQDRLVVERNEDYWNGAPKIEKIIYYPYSDENVRVTNLKSGNTDIVNKVPPKDVEDLKNNSQLEVSEKEALGFQGLYLNLESEPFNNKQLRQALDLVIDREALVKVALRDMAVPSAGAIPPSSWAYDESVTVTERDIEKAKKLLAEAGHPDGFSFTLKLAPKPIEEQLGQMIQSMAKEAGIEVKLEMVEFGALIDQMNSFDFDAIRLGWSGRVDPDGNLHPLFHTGGSINYGFSDEKMDKLLSDARETSDQEERKKLYTEASLYAKEEVPYIFLYHEIDFNAYKLFVKDFKQLPDNMMRFHEVSVQ